MKIRKWLVAGVAVVLIIPAFVFLKVGVREPEIGNGPPKEMTIIMAWNGREVQIPAPVRFPEWGKQTPEFRRWKWKKNVQDFATFDLEGYKYIAHGLGFSADPQDPEGELMPDINAVSRYRPDGKKESYTNYNSHGPTEWYIYDEGGQKTKRVGRTSTGLEVDFYDAEEHRCKEWSVNKKGRIYWESVRQDGKWVVTRDMRDLKTADDVSWEGSLREIMAYYPGREAK